MRGERAFKHGGEGLAAMAEWLVDAAGGMPPAAIGVAIETPRGPVAESLHAPGFAVHSINPKQLDRFRDRHSPAGAKDDRRDARVLASALRTDPHALRRVEPAGPAVVELREWARIATDLKRDRGRLANRLRDQLWRYYPQFIEVVDDVAAPWALALWKRAPNAAAARGERATTYAKLLKKHRIRRFDGDALKRLLDRRPPAIDAAAADAAERHVRVLAAQLRVVNDELARALAERNACLDRLGSADAADAETAPGQSGEQRDVAILLSLPGVGQTVAATLFAEAHDPLRRRDYHALRCLCGVAPVTRQSGRTRIVTRRLAVHGRLRDALYHGARVAMQHDPACRARYDALRARGHGHHRALRSVGDRLLNVACAMLRDGTMFDPEAAAAWIGRVVRTRSGRAVGSRSRTAGSTLPAVVNLFAAGLGASPEGPERSGGAA